jgi:hypothetical protein
MCSRALFTRLEQFFLRELVDTQRDSVMPIWQSLSSRRLKMWPPAASP